MREKRRNAGALRRYSPLLLLAAVLVITAAGIALSWQTTVHRMEGQQAESVRRTAEVFQDEIQRQLAVLDGYSASFTREGLQDHDELLRKLSRCVQNTEFALACFAYPDGTLYRNDDAKVQVSHRYYFQRAMQGEHVVELLENSAIDPTRRVGMAVPVLLDGEVAGVLLGLYDRAGFQSLFERTFAESRGQIYICDSRGNLILGTAEAESFMQEHGLQLEDGSLMAILEAAVFSEGSKDQVAQQMGRGESGQVAYRYDGEQRYTTYTPLGANDWYIVSVLREDRIYEEAIGVTGIFYAMIFAALFAVLVIILYLLNKERKQAEAERKRSEEIQYLLEHDSLTGILSEQAFLEQVKDRLSIVKPHEYCLIYLDIYKFKLINEMFGYQKGNELLCALAEELEKFSQRCDGLCGRISGDQFVLFVPHKEEIIREFGTKNYREKRIVPLDLYLHYGVYVIWDPAIPVDRMVGAAKLAQETVKGNYDHCVAYYDENIKQKQVKEQEIITSMTRALEDGEFMVYLQPQYNYRTGAISGAEALVRWNSKTKGLISPGEFVPVFETNGFIIWLDEYIWEQVCRQQRIWLDQGKDVLPISVNVSRADLLAGAITEKLTGLIQKYGLTPDMLRVEITESAYIDNPKQLIQEINCLAEAGFLVEMDDFGSGYSSLNMLKDVPFQVLKTDLEFLSATGDESRKDSILDGVIRMAHEMGMLVVAEGVETKEQADYLLGLNCEQMQGYYFSKPLSVEDFEKLVYGQ